MQACSRLPRTHILPDKIKITTLKTLHKYHTVPFVCQKYYTSSYINLILLNPPCIMVRCFLQLSDNLCYLLVSPCAKIDFGYSIFRYIQNVIASYLTSSQTHLSQSVVTTTTVYHCNDFGFSFIQNDCAINH